LKFENNIKLTPEELAELREADKSLMDASLVYHEFIKVNTVGKIINNAM
jgi:hypothetical protein